MLLIIKESFDKDVEKVQNKELLIRLSESIRQIEKANQIKEIPNIKKLKGYKNHYRIKLGDYRIGCEIFGKDIYLVRFLHRKDMYRYFPR